MKKVVLLLSLLVFFFRLSAQQQAVISGTLKNDKNQPVFLANVSVKGTSIGTTSDEKGNYELSVPSDSLIELSISYIGYKTILIPLKLQVGEQRIINRSFQSGAVDITEVVVEDKQLRKENITKIDPKIVYALPNAGGNFESILKTLPGVASNSELSSQYSVRGGNYDENLVYVNDIEIYRPLLIRSGQQEGLSFINSEMVSGVKFSSGGFDAKYGDKLSSVLDISYKTPVKFEGIASLGLLTNSLSAGGRSKNFRLGYLFGFRQKSSRSLLSTLDTKGEYKPSYVDFQSYITYALSPKWEIGLLTHISRNKYSLVPESRETSFGTFGNVLRLKVFFEGQEIDEFQTAMAGLSATYTANNNLRLKFISSGFHILEDERFDIEGQYIFSEVETDFGKSSFGEVKSDIGIGGYMNHARNYLQANVVNLEHKGIYSYRKQVLQWGVKYQREQIKDQLREWVLIDSAGYSIPDRQDELLLSQFIQSDNELSSNRYNSYIQNTFNLSDSNNISLTLGGRVTYWDLNKELLASPRATFSFQPRWERDIVFRISSGYYYQPAFYRELRDLNGNLNRNIKAQQSIHYVAAADYQFRMLRSKRPFKLVAEVYYKKLDNLIPYEVDNVRIRYYSNSTATGYATGLDLRLNGEFVPDLESWFSLSLLKTAEDIKDDFYFKKVGEDSVRVEPGYIPRPTDQRFTFSILFQDKLVRDPSFKVHLNLVFGSSLPIGPPDFQRYKDTLRIPPYRRVDIGFSKEVIGPGMKKIQLFGTNFFKSIIIYGEVFNLLQISNTISYLWVRDVNDVQYGVPNYLTSRQLNLRLVAKF